MSLRLSGGRRLQSPPGSTARPTPARVRLAVMNMLAPQLPGAAWLDLFCGSGVMGCEALQRGAASVVAVDQDRRNVATAQANLKAVAGGLTPPPPVQVIQQEVLRWLDQGNRADAATELQSGKFDLIYADPPYAAGLYEPVAASVLSHGWLKPGGKLLLECASSQLTPLPEGWELIKLKRYGSSSVLVLEPLLEPHPEPPETA